MLGRLLSLSHTKWVLYCIWLVCCCSQDVGTFKLIHPDMKFDPNSNPPSFASDEQVSSHSQRCASHPNYRNRFEWKEKSRTNEKMVKAAIENWTRQKPKKPEMRKEFNNALSLWLQRNWLNENSDTTRILTVRPRRQPSCQVDSISLFVQAHIQFIVFIMFIHTRRHICTSFA